MGELWACEIESITCCIYYIAEESRGKLESLGLWPRTLAAELQTVGVRRAKSHVFSNYSDGSQEICS